MNRPARPFVDRPVTDLVAATRLAERVAWRLHLPAPALMRTGMNASFAAGDVVIRVGRPSADPHLALALADRLHAAGIRVPRPASTEAVVDGDLAATCWQRIESAVLPVDWRVVGEMVRAVHALGEHDVVPPGYPVPSPTGFPWWDFEAMLAATRDTIDRPAWDALRATVDRDAGWSDFSAADTVVCHGDVHPGNVMATADGPVLLDWDLMCRAPAAWDHAALITWAERWGGDPGVYPAFADGYGADLSADPDARRLAELRNVAATLLRVGAGRIDASAAAEAERRLCYWRGEPDAPQWRAQ